MDRDGPDWRRIRFTIRTHDGHPWLARPEAVQRLRTAFRRVARQRPWVWGAAVVLPDAVHGLWKLPPDDPDPRPRWQAVKAHCTRHLRHWPGLPDGRLWARGTQWWVIGPEAWEEAIAAIHWEPVRRGLVGAPEAWRYSSCRGFSRRLRYVGGASPASEAGS